MLNPRSFMSFAATICLSVTIPAGIASASVTEDFEAGTAGTQPAGIAYSSLSGGSSATLVDQSSSPSDPIGPAGNQSLRINDPSTTHSATVGFRAGTSIQNGTLKVDFNNTTGSRLYIILGDKVAASPLGGTDRALTLYMSTGGNVLNLGTGAQKLDAFAISADTNYSLEITFDAATNKWSGSINGTALTAEDGTITSFNFLNDLNGINTLQFSTNSSRTADSFVDNLSLTAAPEPGSLGVVGSGVLMQISRKWLRPTPTSERSEESDPLALFTAQRTQ